MGSWANNNRFADTYFSEFRLWSVARTGSFECVSEATDDLVVWYKMDSNTQLTDYSGNGYTATVYGTATESTEKPDGETC